VISGDHRDNVTRGVAKVTDWFDALVAVYENCIAPAAAPFAVTQTAAHASFCARMRELPGPQETKKRAKSAAENRVVLATRPLVSNRSSCHAVIVNVDVPADTIASTPHAGWVVRHAADETGKAGATAVGIVRS